MNAFPSRALRRAAVLLLATGSLMFASRLAAQDAVSNFGQGGTLGQATIGNDSGMNWQRVFEFTTGASAASFDFTGVTVSFVNGGGTPPSLNVALYSGFDATTLAGTSGLVTNLALGSGNPLVAGTAQFTGTATLNASTTYYVALSAGTPSTGNYYAFPVTDAYGEDAGGLSGWTIANGAWDNYPNNFVSPATKWTFDPSVPVFSVQATAAGSAVPEPSTYAALAGICMLGVALWSRGQRRRRVAL